jgi:hypothetical protein
VPSDVVNVFQPAGTVTAGEGASLGAGLVAVAVAVAVLVAAPVAAGGELVAGPAAGDPQPASTATAQAAEKAVTNDPVRRMHPPPRKIKWLDNSLVFGRQN